MNRFKKELVKRGFKLEKDYPFLPFETGGAILESIVVNSENCIVSNCYTSIVVQKKINRDFSVNYI